MSDVRALLKAKRQEARINHPLASYSSTGQLRCVACGTVVKQAASWNGHVGSKSHRLNAAKLKEAEQARHLQAEEEQSLQAKRKSEALEDADEDVVMVDTKKRKVADTDEDVQTAAAAAPSASAPPHGFPSDFFSDPSMAPSTQWDDEDEGPDAPQPSFVDEEWQRFQQAVLNPPMDEDNRDTYDRATITAQPVLASEVPEGFPSTLAQDEVAPAEPESALTEEEVRREKEQDERELIMDRLLDEERAQEEADAKVTMLKNRLDALKRRREAAKAERTKKKT